jgi:hypothetical protein
VAQIARELDDRSHGFPAPQPCSSRSESQIDGPK